MPETPKKKFRIRFGFKTLAALTVLFAGIAWWYAIGYAMWLDYRDRVAFQSISEYELGQAEDVRLEQKSIPGLVTIIGQSRLKHWNNVCYGAPLVNDQFISWGFDRTVRIWDIETGQAVKTYFADEVLASGDGEKYFVRRKKEIEVFDASGHKKLFNIEIPGKTEPKLLIRRWATNKNGNRLVVFWEKQIQVFDSEQHEWILRIPVDPRLTSLNQVVLNGLGDRIVATNRRTIVAYDLNGPDVESGTSYSTRELNKESPEPDRSFSVLEPFPNGTEFLVIENQGRNLYRYDSVFNTIELLGNRHLNTIDTTITEGFIIIGGNNSQVEWLIWPNFVKSREISREFRRLKSARVISANLNGSKIVTGEANQIHIWDENGEVTPGKATNWKPTCFGFSPNGRDLAVGYHDGTVLIYRVGSWNLKKSVRLGFYPIKTLAYSKNGDMAVRDWQELKVFNRHNYSLVYEKKTSDLKFGIAMNFSADGAQLAIHVGGKGPNEIQLIDYRQDKILRSYQIPAAELRYITKSPNGQPKNHLRRVCGTIEFDSASQYLIAPTGYGSYSYWDFETGKFIGHGGIPEDWDGRDALAKLSKDGKLVAMNTFQYGMGFWQAPNATQNVPSNEPVHFWSIPDNESYNHIIFDFEFSNSNQQIASVAADGYLKIRDVKSGELLHKIQLSGFGSKIPGVAYSRDDRYIATLNGNGTVYIIRNPAR